MPAPASCLRPSPVPSPNRATRRGARRFRCKDRVVWRNRRGRLCHGIVQLVQGGVLFVEESFPIEPRKGASVYDAAFFQSSDFENWEILTAGEILRKVNL